MTMRGGLTIVTGASRPKFVYTHAVNPSWLAELRKVLAPDPAPLGTDLNKVAPDKGASQTNNGKHPAPARHARLRLDLDGA